MAAGRREASCSTWIRASAPPMAIRRWDIWPLTAGFGLANPRFPASILARRTDHPAEFGV